MGVAGWLTVTALLFTNAIWHVVGAVKTRSYSPGVLTGLVLYVPLAVYGYARLLGSGKASVQAALVCFAIGASYQFWATAIHKWRAGRARG
jgi:hypothetical protein